ncbi:MAG: 2TM domain-containing protein [Burkholderiales bacterium]
MNAFRRHVVAFVLVNAALTGVNIYTGAPWWAFWPLVFWGLVLMVHFFFHRAATVDDAWVKERTEDLRSKSYDLGHSDDIRGQPTPSIRDAHTAPPKSER